MSIPYLSVKNLSREFKAQGRTVRAVDSVSFDIPVGDLQPGGQIGLQQNHLGPCHCRAGQTQCGLHAVRRTA